MIELALPWALALLPLPLVVCLLLSRAAEQVDGALRVPFYDTVEGLGGAGAGAPRFATAAAVVLKTFVWLGLVLAAAQPQWIGAPQPIETSGRDLMLALDVSGSMEQEDFAVGGRLVSRHAVVNAVAKRFVAAREGDRVGLVLFGSRAYLQTPLTHDLETVTAMLGESEVGLAGRETAIGDAIGIAVKHLRDRPAPERVLVLLSDGRSNAGVADPMRAAKFAAESGVRIHTIGVGSTGAAGSFFAMQVPPEERLDEAALRALASETGGAYFRADDTESLVAVYDEIDRLEPTSGEPLLLRPSRALFYWPLAAALVAAAGLLTVRGLSGVTLPWLRRSALALPRSARGRA